MKSILTILAVLISTTSAFANTPSTVEASMNDQMFIISSQLFQAETDCFNVRVGDQVLLGKDGRQCVSEFLNLSTGSVCKVKCRQ